MIKSFISPQDIIKEFDNLTDIHELAATVVISNLIVMIKVLMIARSTLYSSPGGDTVQIEMTAKHLRNLGVEVNIQTSENKIDYSLYNFLHFFNIIRPDDILPHLSDKQIPFVISPIFVDYLEYEHKARQGIYSFIVKKLNRDQIEYLKTIMRLIKNREYIKSFFYLTRGHRKSIKLLAKQAGMLLPNSHSEYKRLNQFYGINKKYQKVVNAIDPNYFNTKVQANHKFDGHILCVGRIEGRKNQLNLIKALINTDLQLTIIGKASPNHIHYYEQCVALAANSPNIHFINNLNHKELAAIYKAAKVHVLPSWFETTGLSSLEAGAMGCNLVITKKGDTEEYFHDMAYYCEPDDITSIREAVLQAYHTPVNPDLQNFILNNYTWENTARQTLEAYRAVLGIIDIPLST